ncbi:NUDIX hydrolase [Clostridium sp. D2Q-14]|uniref:NUDIX hydrolase n=1 Tax=Anaeromonas gelatinilytica TaxID=2683194 RepID=UPI00193C25C3|nr:NUDIX hydrolase [Anaeromonas gelatinilytica]MBS4534793.1 NUDIX hydrolase [Anaeromonas gelatinilytica]
MRKEISSGGVVVFCNTILLLKKYNGDWVLPKGRVEDNETLMEAAIREVCEEGNVKGEIIQYLGSINYYFRNNRNPRNKLINKTVHWYLMKTSRMNCSPQKKEGFIEARFVHIDRAISIAKYEDERKIIKRAINKINFD